MKQTSIFLAFLLCSFFGSIGQLKLDDRHQIDSIKAVIANKNTSDADKSDAYMDLAERYSFWSTDSAKNYGNKAILFGHKSENATFLTNAYIIQAGIHEAEGEYESFILTIDSAIDLSIQKKYTLGTEMAYTTKGTFYHGQGKMDSARLMFEKGLVYADSIGKAIIYSNIAVILKIEGKSIQASRAYMSAVSMIEKHSENADLYLTNFYGNLGNTKNDLGDFEAGFQYNKLALEAAIKTGNISAQSIHHGSIGRYHKRREEYDKAIEHFRNGLAISQGNESAKNDRLIDMALCFLDMKEANSAQKYINQVQKTAWDEYGKIDYYSALAQVLSYNSKYEQAFTAIDTVFSMPLIKVDVDKRNASYKTKSLLYEQAGEYKKALLWKNKAIALSDSLNQQQSSMALLEMEEIYETEKKEIEIVKLAKENEIAELESKQNKNYFIGASIIGLLIFGISIIAYNQLRLRRKADLAQQQLRNSQETMKLESQFREAELKALKSQMNPHFIFNALNSIQEYIILNDKENAANYLGKFADLIRNYLYHSNTGKISLADELESLTLYLELEQVRFEEDFTFEIKKSLQDSATNIEIPTMLIQPYVENAIKHGLLHKPGEKKLLLNFVERENSLDCEIIDNGVGREKSNQINAKRRKGHQSFASEATQSRLELLNHQSDAKIGVEILDLVDGTQALGTKVVIRVPKE